MKRLIVIGMAEFPDGQPPLGQRGCEQMERIAEALHPILKGHRVRLITGELSWMRGAASIVGNVLGIVQGPTSPWMSCAGRPSHEVAVKIMSELLISPEKLVVALLRSDHATALIWHVDKYHARDEPRTRGRAGCWMPSIDPGNAALIDLRSGLRVEILVPQPRPSISRAG